MSHEGVVLMSKAALVIVMILAGSIFRALAGRGRRVDVLMLCGTLGGMSSGIAIAALLNRAGAADVSAVCGCLGMVAGWAMAWRVARRLPREVR